MQFTNATPNHATPLTEQRSEMGDSPQPGIKPSRWLSCREGGFTRVLRNVWLLVLVLAATVACGGQTNLPTIFVAPISGGARMYAWRPSMGEAVAEALLNYLVASRKFQVLETSGLEILRREIQMGNDGWMEPSHQTEKGHWLGADYMLTCKLIQFERPPNSSSGGLVKGLENLFPKKPKVKLSWRVVNISTRATMASGTADFSQNREKFGFGTLAKGVLGGAEEGNEALEQALSAVLGRIAYDVEQLNLPPVERGSSPTGRPALASPGLIGPVEAVKPEFLIVGVGSKHGCKVGDKLELCEVIEVKNSEGNPVFQDQKVVGEVEIQMCLNDRSKVSYSSLVSPKEGWVVRGKTSTRH